MKIIKKTSVSVLFILYLALLLWIVLFKLQFSIDALDRLRSVNLIPFYYEREVGGAFHLKELLENLLIFVPMGIYLPMLLPKTSFRAKALSIAAASLALECAQYALAIGRSDITDLLTNIAGGLLGLALYSGAAHLLHGSDKADRMFFYMAGIASAIVIGLLAFILCANR